MAPEIKQIKLKRNRESGIYRVVEENDAKLSRLCQFLSEITSGFTYTMYLDWLENPLDCKGVGSNAFGLEEYKGRIYVGAEWDSQKKRYSYFSTNTKGEMLAIINQWAEVLNKNNPRPLEIIITEEDGKVSITAIDSTSIA